MTQCIGRMGGRPGDWFAELDFENGEAQVIERGRVQVQVCTVPLGEWVPETDEHFAALDPDCPQAKRLCKIVFAPEAWATLASIRERLSRVPGLDSAHPSEDIARAYEIARDEIVDQIERTLGYLDVPGNGE